MVEAWSWDQKIIGMFRRTLFTQGTNIDGNLVPGAYDMVTRTLHRSRSCYSIVKILEVVLAQNAFHALKKANNQL